MVIRVRLLRAATAIAGAAALGLTFAGTAHADHLGGGVAHNPSESSKNADEAAEDGTGSEDEDAADSADEDSLDEDSADGDGYDDPDDPPRKRVVKEGLYGIDEDPDTMIHKNLDGETESPGFHHDGLGTVEVPRVATH